MFKVRVEMCSKFSNTYAGFKCPVCGMEQMRQFFEDVPIYSGLDSCWSCQNFLVDFERMIRKRESRIFYHLTGKLPMSNKQFVMF